MTEENCNQCPHIVYCPDKGTETECKPKLPQENKIFHFGRASGKKMRMLEAAIKFTETNNDEGGFALISVIELKKLFCVSDIEAILIKNRSFLDKCSCPCFNQNGKLIFKKQPRSGELINFLMEQFMKAGN